MIDAVFRRIQMMFGRGRVTYTDDSGPVQKMQVRLSGLETSDGRVRMAEFGFTSNPPIGSDVLALHISGDRGAGTVFATNHQASRPKGLLPGESKLYSQDGKFVYITASGGISVFANGQPVNVTGATTVTINATTKVRMVTPRLECTGDIIDNCDTTGRTMVADRAIYDSHEHNVTGIQTGGSTVVSNPPNQPE
jgi:phage baseplate assembly protein V